MTAKAAIGSLTIAMLTALIPKARFGSELLKTNREILGTSLRTPTNTAELSSVNELVPMVENVPSTVRQK